MELDKSQPKQSETSAGDPIPKRDSKARTASAAVFFNDNKSIAGFGNSMRAVFTSVRELVENSLDAAEKRGVTPKIHVNLRKLEKSELIELMGTKVIKTKDKRVEFIELSCKDNGVGVSRELIPQLFGTVLAGTKYGAQQTRGRFGLGVKMVLLYAMSTLDLPIQITTRPEGENTTYRVKLFIDLEKNAPIIVSDEKYKEGDDEYFEDYGTEIKVSFTGSWSLAKLYVREYFKQLAIITPYADMFVDLPSDDTDGQDNLVFQRVVDNIPKPPQVVKVHPWGTDISTFRREITHSSEDNLIDFLHENFMGVSKSAAEAFFKEVDVDETKAPHDLTSQEIRRIVHDGFNRALKESRTVSRKRDRIFKFDEPKGDALSPLGADRLRRGLEKELEPEFVEAIEREPRAYEGHPFIIEAAIGYGGGVNSAANSKGVTIVDNRVIYRFANRIPLIFGAGSDLITNVANSINWSKYGLTRGTEPLAIAVSLVSTKIPFPETSKEYIDKVEEIGEEVRLTLLQLGRKLKTFLGRRRRRQRERRRKSRFEKYAPQTVRNLLKILEKEGLWDPTTGVSPQRIISALASGKPRIDSKIIPMREQVFQAPVWSTTETQIKLQENGIHELPTFLRTGNKKLADILGTSTKEIDQIKRRSINELDKAGEIPELDTEIILSSDDEIRFHRRDDREKLIELPRLYKACNRRWIRNAYDYLVSPPEQLNKVLGLSIKLIEAERVHIITNLFEEVEEVDLADELSSLFEEGALLGDFEGEIDKFTQEDLPEEMKAGIESKEAESKEEKKIEKSEKDEKLTITLEQLFPPLEDIYEFEPLKKRKVSSIVEFLLETTHPSSPIDEKVLAPLLIPSFVDNLEKLIEKDPQYGKIKVNVSSQKWIDGYLRNAFKRRKIVTTKDVTKFDTDKLIEVGELQRTLFYGLVESLIPKKSELRVEEFGTTNAEKKVKYLSKAGIDSLEKFAATPSDELATNEDLWPYISLLLEESKDKIIEQLTIDNQMGPLSWLKEITPEIEEELERLGISNLMDLLIKPHDKFKDDLKPRIKHAKQVVGMGFDGFYKKHQSAFDDANIVILEELVYNPDYYLEKDLSQTSTEDLQEAVEYIMEPVVLISPNLLSSLDILHDGGVTTVGKFLTWPTNSLSEVTDMPEEWLNLIKESFHVQDIKSTRKDLLKPLEVVDNILTEKEISYLEDYDIETVQEAVALKWGDIIPSSVKKWKSIKKLNELLLSPIEELLDDIKKEKYISNAFEELKEEYNIKTVLQYLRLPTSSITQKISKKRNREAAEQLSHDLKSNDPQLINEKSTFYKAGITYRAIEKLQSPIVFMSGFTVREVSLLNEIGIKTIHQLITSDLSNIEKETGMKASELEKRINKSSFKQQGTPIALSDSRGNLHSIITFEREGNTYFEQEEINALSTSGYNTIESLFYSTDHRTFDVHGVSWEIISHFKKLMQSPPVLITWMKIIKEEVEKTGEEEMMGEAALFKSASEKDEKKEETEEEDDDEEIEYREVEYYETFTSHELEQLTKANIRRVIDFLTAPTEDIKELLDWDEELARERQTSVILQEAGIELADLDIFRQDHVSHLREMGIITIEDLYFTLKEETWESTVLPWEPIQTLKNILHLQLKHVVEEIGEDIVNLLVENEIETVLEFILTGDPILEQATGLPAERFENLKYALDFGTLIESFDKTVLFTPGLTYEQAKLLIENGYRTILELVLEDKKTISKILDMSEEDISLLFEDIHRNEIMKAEQERGVYLKEINTFSRSDVRSITKSGIFEMNELDTLQEVIYQITPDQFQGENYLLDLVMSLQKVCDIELNKIGDLNQADVAVLENKGIKTVGDALLINYEDLNEDLKVDTSLSTVTKSLFDLQAFVAIGKIKSRAAMMEGEDETPLLDKWMNDPDGLHKRTMRNIRSILSLPVKLTSLAKLIDTPIDEIGNDTIADIAMEYIPGEDHEHYLIQQKINEQGSLVRLLQEGSTPLTLLDLSPDEFRPLLENGINTIERVLMHDVKELSKIAGTTQKYWKEIKEVFDPEVFSARMGDIGIPIDILELEKEDKEYLQNYDIKYLDQVTVYDDPKGIIGELRDFLVAPTIYLSGHPGEREFAENFNAKTIVEAMMAIKKEKLSSDLLNEMIVLAWEAYQSNRIMLPDKYQKNGIETVQKLASEVLFESSTPTKSQREYIEPFVKSPLLLPLSSDELEELVKNKRCVTVIDALTSPMVTGKITSIRDQVKKNGKIEVLSEIDLPNIMLKDISKTIWKRIEKSDLSLQEVLSSPRTIEVYKSTKQKYLQEARNALKIPLSRIHNNGNQPLLKIDNSNKYLRLEDILFDLPELLKKQPNIVETISSFLGSPDIEVLNDLDLSEDLIIAAETAFGSKVEGFHDLWISTWRGVNVLQKIDTNPSAKLIDFVKSAFRDVSNIKSIKPIEIWQFWQLNVLSISDVLLIPRDDLGSTDFFTKKRISELKSHALKSLNNKDNIESYDVFTTASKFDIEFTKDISIPLPLMFHDNPHPLFEEQYDQIPEEFYNILTTPLMITEFGQSLSTNTLQQFYRAKIYSVIDFIVYPEKLKELPKNLRDVDSRLEKLQEGYEVEYTDKNVDDLKLPVILYDEYGKSINLSRLLFEIENSKNMKIVKSLSIPLKYSNFDEEEIEELDKEGISSVYDLLYRSAKKIDEITGSGVENIEKKLAELDIISMYEHLTEAPLQVVDIDSISQGGRDILRDEYIYTVLDLVDPLPGELNRIDTSYLTTIIQILESDPSFFLTFEKFGRDGVNQAMKLEHKTIREIILNRDAYSKKLQKSLSSLKTADLIEFQEKHRDLHDLEDIIIKDEKNLVKSGYFNFIAVANSSTLDLIDAGVAKSKASDIFDIINSHWRNIINFPQKAEDISEELELETVAEVLTAPEIFDVELKTPIKVRREIKFSQLLPDVPEPLHKANVKTVSEFIRSDKLQKAFHNNDEDVIKLVGILNASVSKLPKINSKWISKLESKGINRIWEYILEDSNALADICGSSIKAQEKFRDSLSLSKFEHQEFSIPTASDEDESLFKKYGIYSVKELIGDSHLKNYITDHDDIMTKIEAYRDVMDLKVFKLQAYWDFDAEERRNIAKKALTLKDMPKVDVKIAEKLISNALKGKFRDEHDLDQWITDKDELEKLESKGISTVESWMYYNTRGEIEPGSKSFILFRSTFDIIPYFTIKHIVSGYKNKMTHISDMLLEENKEIAKKLRTTTNKVEELLKGIPDIGPERPELPNLGLVSSSIVDSMREGGIYSWAQILGNAVKEEIELIKGVTWNTVTSVRENAQVPIWHSLELRSLGLDNLKKLTSEGVETIADILVLGEKFKEFLGDEDQYLHIIENISRANLNKGAKQISIRVSESYKIRVKDIEDYEKAGIHSPIDILIGNYDIQDDSELKDGVDDWIRLGDLDVKEINFPMKVIKSLRKMGIKTLGDAIIAPNHVLREAGATNHQIKLFRKDLNRLSKGEKRIGS